MNPLLTQRCNREFAKNPLEKSTIEQLLLTLSHWTIEENALTASFSFTNYHQTIAFVNALAWIAHRENHHPDLSVHYNRVIVCFSTHEVKGITLNDFICAAKTTALLALEV